MNNTSVILNNMNVLSRLTGVRRGGRGVAAKCPAHDDNKQSLCLAEDDGSTYSMNELQCRRDPLSVNIKASLSPCYSRSPNEPRIHCVYPYVDANNVLLYENVRFHPKGFRQRHFDTSGKPIWHLNGIRDIKKRSLNKQQRVFEPV